MKGSARACCNVGAVAVAVAGLGCSSSSQPLEDGAAPTPCVQGRSLPCAGLGGCSGYQVCQADEKTYGPCQCGGPLDAGTDASGGDATVGDGGAHDGAGGTRADSTLDEASSGGDSGVEGALGDAGACSPVASDASNPLDGALFCSPLPTCPQGMVGVPGTLACARTDDPAYGCGTGTACHIANALAICRAGACAYSACAPGFADCDGDPTNGCEADLESPSTCTACNIACVSGEQCLSTGCVSACASPNTNCAGTCRNLASDPRACGSCSVSCGPGGTCSNGACNTSCAAGFTACGSNGANSCSAACCTTCSTAPYSNAVGTVSGGGECFHDSRPGATSAGCFPLCAPPYTRCPPYFIGRADCVNTATDNANCGGCGIACGSGQVCLRGCCQPKSAIQWISGVTPTHIAQDANNIYWTDPGDDTINAASKSTGQRVVLATSSSGWMAIDDAYVYWIGNGEAGLAALRVAKIGGTVTQIATVGAGASEIAVDATTLYWLDPGSGQSCTNGTCTTFYQVPKTGGTPTTCFAMRGVQDLAGLYFTVAGGGVYSLGGCSAQPTLVTPQGLTGCSDISADDHGYYYLISNAATATGVDIGVNTQLNSLPGPIPPPPAPHTIASDGCFEIYWTTALDIWRIPRYASYPVQVFAGGTRPMEPAVDNSYLYWTDSSGFIGRIAKY